MNIFLVLLVSVVVSSGRRDEFPKINSIFKSLSLDVKDAQPAAKPPDARVKNIDINLETLDMNKFHEKIKSYGRTFSGNASNANNRLLKEYNTRRLARIGESDDWQRASKTLVKNKLFDLMLQTIYMARHKIKQIENDPYYNPEDTSYRIAFLFRKMRRILKKMRDIHRTMTQNVRKTWGLNKFLILHHKAARLHVDFLYLWWVMVRLDERYQFRHGILKTTPRPGLYIGT